jgi:hypothetical protein
MAPLYINGLIDYGQLSADPTSPSPSEGSKYWNTTDNRKYVYNGSKWEKLAAGTIVFDYSNTTHYWPSDNIASITSWTAEKGGSGANWVAAAGTGEMTYTSSDSNMGGQKSLTTTAGNTGLLSNTQTEDVYWDGTEAWSVMVVMRKTSQNSGGTHGDGCFIQGRAGQVSGSWSLDITGDHTWSNDFGEVFSSAGAYSPGYPAKGIMLVRMSANGASGQLAWHNGTSWAERATCSSLPSSLPSDFDSLNIFNFDTTSANHDFSGSISEIAYYKGTRIDDTERDAFTTYALSKFW